MIASYNWTAVIQDSLSLLLGMQDGTTLPINLDAQKLWTTIMQVAESVNAEQTMEQTISAITPLFLAVQPVVEDQGSQRSILLVHLILDLEHIIRTQLTSLGDNLAEYLEQNPSAAAAAKRIVEAEPELANKIFMALLDPWAIQVRKKSL